MTVDRLDSRAWLAWGIGATVPILVARNPLVVLEVLIIALAVRAVWSFRSRQGWQWILRIAVVFTLVGVVFNALTVHAGNQVLFRVPDLVPLVGGPITLNAVAYGIVSGVAIVTLVLVGTTVAAGLVWAELMRSLPPRIAPIAVAGSVAWSFLPNAAQAFKEIRESQPSRGHRVRGVRDLPPLVVPLLGGGLERALAMSEELEACGFGHRVAESASSSFARWFLVGALGNATLMSYALAVGQIITGSIGMMMSLVLMLLATKTSGPVVGRPTRYRSTGWSRTDLIVVGAAIVAGASFLWRRFQVPEAAIFNLYPNLEWPLTDLGMLISLSLLIVPALIVPGAGEGA